jgi:hypothetical protein
MSEGEYHKLADETIHDLLGKLEVLLHSKTLARSILSTFLWLILFFVFLV